MRFRILSIFLALLALGLPACQPAREIVRNSTSTAPPALPPAASVTIFPATSLPLITATIVPTFSSSPSPTAAAMTPVASPEPSPQPTSTGMNMIYKDSAQPVEARIEDLLKRMSLEEKIGQMTQVEKNSIRPGDITAYFIGSILSGGGGSPSGNNTARGWYEMVSGFQAEALQTPLGIPLIYGVDAVHGHGNLYGATVFPHNIGLGATRDASLVERIGKATAEEMLATDIPWNFAPTVAVPQDIRWGRTYEGFGENTQLVTELGVAYLRGLQAVAVSGSSRSIAVLATPKHYLGDGGTTFGSSTQNINQPYLLDQGDMRMDEARLRQLFLQPYQEAVQAGAMSVMASFSSWNGTKMHGNRYLLTDVLKGELGFTGFVVSDWGGIDQVSPDYYQAVVTAINAGVDMNMVPFDYHRFIDAMKAAVNNGDITEERVDDAVRRILRVKFMLGLFENPDQDPALLAAVGSDAHRELAREAVRKSLVLLKNEGQTLPLAKDTPLILIGGAGGNDIGLQSGGWTIEWLGKPGDITPGTTIFEAFQNVVANPEQVKYDRQGEFSGLSDAGGSPIRADIGVAVVAEQPYAEGVGDRADLSLSASDVALIQKLRERSNKLVVIVLSGRPVILTKQVPQVDALVAAWLPGTEGQGIADVIFGDYPFTGKLSYSWPRSNAQLPYHFSALPSEGCAAPLFPYGYGLGDGSQPVQWLECP